MANPANPVPSIAGVLKSSRNRRVLVTSVGRGQSMPHAAEILPKLDDPCDVIVSEQELERAAEKIGVSREEQVGIR